VWLDNVLQKECKIRHISRYRKGEANMMIKSYVFTCHLKVVGQNKKQAWKQLEKSIHIIKRKDFKLTKIDWTPSARQIIKYLSEKGNPVTTNLRTGRKGVSGQ